MSYLIDTCVVSELRKPIPQDSVLAWFQACDEKEIYISALSLGELRFGISILPGGKKRNDLLVWFNELIEAFSGMILPVTEGISIIWGNMRARAKKNGLTLPVVDGLIAATAEAHQMILVTRNTDDVETTGISILNPWQQA